MLEGKCWRACFSSHRACATRCPPPQGRAGEAAVGQAELVSAATNGSTQLASGLARPPTAARSLHASTPGKHVRPRQHGEKSPVRARNRAPGGSPFWRAPRTPRCTQPAGISSAEQQSSAALQHRAKRINLRAKKGGIAQGGGNAEEQTQANARGRQARTTAKQNRQRNDTISTRSTRAGVAPGRWPGSSLSVQGRGSCIRYAQDSAKTGEAAIRAGAPPHKHDQGQGASATRAAHARCERKPNQPGQRRQRRSRAHACAGMCEPALPAGSSKFFEPQLGRFAAGRRTGARAEQRQQQPTNPAEQQDGRGGRAPSARLWAAVGRTHPHRTNAPLRSRSGRFSQGSAPPHTAGLHSTV